MENVPHDGCLKELLSNDRPHHFLHILLSYPQPKLRGLSSTVSASSIGMFEDADPNSGPAQRKFLKKYECIVLILSESKIRSKVRSNRTKHSISTQL